MQVLFDLSGRGYYHPRMVFQRLRPITVAFFFCLVAATQAADTFRVATYNVENYLEVSNGSRPAKSTEARAKVREGIIALKPDVIALEEIGGTNALLELQGSLKADGLELPYSELVSGADTNINVAVLSRLPIVARRPLRILPSPSPRCASSGSDAPTPPWRKAAACRRCAHPCVRRNRPMADAR